MVNNFTINYLVSQLQNDSNENLMSASPLQSPLIKHTSSIVRNQSASVSVASSKQQTPIKSPSPDNLCRNVLTPTKVKYVGDVGVARVVQMYHSEVRRETSNHRPQWDRKGAENDYIRQLEQQIQVLTIENKNLLQRLTISQQKSQSYLQSSCEPIPPQKSQPTLSNFEPFPSRRPTTLIIEKIKQQYEQKLGTLRLMIEQEMKQAMSVVEEMCELLKNKLLVLEARMEGVEGKMSQIKIDKIKTMDYVFNRTIGKIGQNGSPRGQKIYGSRDESSMSDILCVSIPEEDEQQSRNYTVTITKLEEELDSLRKTINQTQESYNSEKQYLNRVLVEKDQEIARLNIKIENMERNKHFMEWRSGTAGMNVREELRILQKSVSQLGEQLVRSQRECEQVLAMLEEKNIECQSMGQEINILRDKIIGSQRQRVMLEEKTKFLEASMAIQESELRQTKCQLAQQVGRRTSNERERIKKITAQTHRSSTERNVLTLTTRIDKLLALEEEREEKHRQMQMRYGISVGEDGAGLKNYVEEETRVENKEELAG